jgi:hypothetical protein
MKRNGSFQKVNLSNIDQRSVAIKSSHLANQVTLLVNELTKSDKLPQAPEGFAIGPSTAEASDNGRHVAFCRDHAIRKLARLEWKVGQHQSISLPPLVRGTSQTTK